MTTGDLPYDFDALHFTALGLIFLMWWLYTPVLTLLGRGTLNEQLHVVRLKWLLMLIRSRRENRVFDAIMLGQMGINALFPPEAFYRTRPYPVSST